MGVLDLYRLDGRVTVVTGASSGLGAAFAVGLAEAGADVVLAARRVEKLVETAAAVERAGRRAITVPTDVADPDQCAEVASRAMSEFGRIDVLINNAGVGAAVPALRERPEDFRWVLDVNLMGAYWMAQACAREMRPGSSIVNVASTLAFISAPAPQAAYAASKAGLVGMTRDLSSQWAGRKGIRVNALAPGYVATEMTAEVPAEMLNEFIGARSPLQRLAEPDEITAAMLFLASPAAGYVTGSTLAVDGGMSGH